MSYGVWRLTPLSVDDSVQECIEARSNLEEYMGNQDEGAGSRKSHLSEGQQSQPEMLKDRTFSQDGDK